MLQFDKLTVKAQEALQAAQEMGGRAGQQQIEPLHLLWALVAQGDGVVPPLLEKLGVSPTGLASEVEKQIERLPKVSGVSRAISEPGDQQDSGAARSTKRRSEGRVRFHRTHSAGNRRREKDPAGQALIRAKARPTMPFCKRWPRFAAAIA